MPLAEELVNPREPEFALQLLDENLYTSWTNKGIAQRGQHAKHHGCVDGEFVILENIPTAYQHGIFSPGQRYKCKIRFSNGARMDDRKQDVRGLAIKLLKVSGLKMMPGQGMSKEQDFILVDNPTYFTATMEEYLVFNRNITPAIALSRNGFSVGIGVRAAIGIATMFLFHRPILKRMRAFTGRHAGSPLALTYHSTTPYLLGPDKAVKYKAIGQVAAVKDTDEEDGLRTALWSALSDGQVSFDFGVVEQSNADKHPIEDPSVDWEKNGAEFVKLAELILLQQENSEDKDSLATSLKFNPWMSLAAHKPVGSINRMRRLIYDAMSKKRSD